MDDPNTETTAAADPPTAATSSSTSSPAEQLSLSLDLAAADSPAFRATLQRVEDGVESLAGWLEPLCRALRVLADEVNRTHSRVSALGLR